VLLAVVALAVSGCSGAAQQKASERAPTWSVSVSTPLLAFSPDGLGMYQQFVLACASSTVCEAVDGWGSTEERTTNAGASWVSGKLPAGGIAIAAMARPSVTTCAAVGETNFDEFVIRTTDGGLRWSPRTFSLQTGFSSVACASTTTCDAVTASGEAIRTTDGGASWTQPKLPIALDIPVVECPSAASCLVAGGTSSLHDVVLRTVDAGWRGQPPTS
jgi:hypothetical protein